MMRILHLGFALTLAVALAAPRAALATDTWTNVRPGIDWLHRTTGGGTPQDIHAVRIDLTSPRISVRASRDVRGSERGVVTSTFANSVGAVVAINADWSDGATPIGLAIGNGSKWHDHFDNPAIGGEWGYFACDIYNECDIEFLPRLSSVPEFADPTREPYRYFNAVGANGNPLLDDGVRGLGCYDGCSGDVCRNPRSAVCLDAAGDTLWFIVVDGRRASSGAAGMTCGEMRNLVTELGCNRAAMLDGGGSSTMWVDGSVRNRPSDGSQRTVSNHLGIIYTPTPDAACAASPFGAYCDGTEINVCTGGRLVSEGDCGAFGVACGEHDGFAFCVDPRCPGGDGWGVACVDATRIGTCRDGAYSEGDCGAFGLACGSDAGGTRCMDARCPAPTASFCASDGVRATCAAGTYAEVGCGAGSVCVEGGGAARCEAVVTPVEPTPDAGGRDVGRGPDSGNLDGGGSDDSGGGSDTGRADLGGRQDAGDTGGGGVRDVGDAGGRGDAAPPRDSGAGDDSAPSDLGPGGGEGDAPPGGGGGGGGGGGSASADDERDVTHVRVGGCAVARAPDGPAGHDQGGGVPWLVLLGAVALWSRARRRVRDGGAV
jgi:hypothetical protein